MRIQFNKKIDCKKEKNNFLVCDKKMIYMVFSKKPHMFRNSYVAEWRQQRK